MINGPIKHLYQSRTGGKLIRGGRTGDVTPTDGGTSGHIIDGRREANYGSILDATGGTKIESGNDRYHVFTSPGSFYTGTTIKNAEVLVVAGGGSGETGGSMELEVVWWSSSCTIRRSL